MSQAIKKPVKPFYKYYKKFARKKGPNETKLKAVIQLIGPDKVLFTGTYQIFNEELKEAIKKCRGVFSPEDKGWIFQRIYLDQIMQQVKIKTEGLTIYDIPHFVDGILKPFSGTLRYKVDNKSRKITYKEDDKLKKIIDLPKKFQEKLYSFQKKGVEFGIQNFGRVLIADEMGVGKTAQALALASLYRSDWPFVVFAPSSLRFVWNEEILNWFPDIQPEEVQVITKSSQDPRRNIKALVISYDLASKFTDKLRNKFNVAIADEAYYLKNSEAKRTEAIIPLMQECKRCILLAGTPALARPKEIYNLLHILRPDVFSNFTKFGQRYCAPKRNPWSRAMDYSGASNLKELHFMLTNSVMIRRLKSEVLKELPDKIRQKIQVDTDPEYITKIQEAIGNKKGESKTDPKARTKLDEILRDLILAEKQAKDGNTASNIEKLETQISPQIFECYRYTGLAKLQGIKKYLKEIFQQDMKVLVFAHHKEVLDGIQQEVENLKLKFIRIDGEVPSQTRYDLVKSFQNESDIKVGILSLTSGGLGLTLTAANKVIFAEMYWTPAIMFQAEDRIHRIGQKEKVSVNYYYLYGEDTLDTALYKILQHKITIVSKMLEGQAIGLNLNGAEKNEKQKLIQSQACTRPEFKEKMEETKMKQKFIQSQPVTRSEFKEKMVEEKRYRNESIRKDEKSRRVEKRIEEKSLLILDKEIAEISDFSEGDSDNLSMLSDRKIKKIGGRLEEEKKGSRKSRFEQKQEKKLYEKKIKRENWIEEDTMDRYLTNETRKMELETEKKKLYQPKRMLDDPIQKILDWDKNDGLIEMNRKKVKIDNSDLKLIREEEETQRTLESSPNKSSGSKKVSVFLKRKSHEKNKIESMDYINIINLEEETRSSIHQGEESSTQATSSMSQMYFSFKEKYFGDPKQSLQSAKSITVPFNKVEANKSIGLENVTIRSFAEVIARKRDECYNNSRHVILPFAGESSRAIKEISSFRSYLRNLDEEEEEPRIFSDRERSIQRKLLSVQYQDQNE